MWYLNVFHWLPYPVNARLLCYCSLYLQLLYMHVQERQNGLVALFCRPNGKTQLTKTNTITFWSKDTPKKIFSSTFPTQTLAKPGPRLNVGGPNEAQNDQQVHSLLNYYYLKDILDDFLQGLRKIWRFPTPFHMHRSTIYILIVRSEYLRIIHIYFYFK